MGKETSVKGVLRSTVTVTEINNQNLQHIDTVNYGDGSNSVSSTNQKVTEIFTVDEDGVEGWYRYIDVHIPVRVGNKMTLIYTPRKKGVLDFHRIINHTLRSEWSEKRRNRFFNLSLLILLIFIGMPYLAFMVGFAIGFLPFFLISETLGIALGVLGGLIFLFYSVKGLISSHKHNVQLNSYLDYLTTSSYKEFLEE